MSKSPGIFIEDFERTLYSNYIHGIIGRCLIIATRFDSQCKGLSTLLKLKVDMYNGEFNDQNFDKFVKEITCEYENLYSSIESFNTPKEVSDILHDSRKARNDIVHNLTKGLEGLIDIKVEKQNFISEASELIKRITK